MSVTHTLFELASQNGYVVQQMAPRIGRYQSYRIIIDQDTRERVYQSYKATHTEGVDSPFFVYTIPLRPRYESQDMWKERVRDELGVLWDKFLEVQENFRASLERSIEPPQAIEATPLTTVPPEASPEVLDVDKEDIPVMTITKNSGAKSGAKGGAKKGGRPRKVK